MEILILVQDESLEAVEDLLTLTKSPSQIPTNLEEVEKDFSEANLMREYMVNLWSTAYLLGQGDREIQVLCHRLNHCSLKFLLVLFKRINIPSNLRNVRKIPPCAD